LSNYVLFSCVGSTDPIRDNFDGPMLHIIRHYQPHTVYIFLSQEMGMREEKDRRFSRAVELLAGKLGRSIDTHLIFSGIHNPHDFDAFLGVFSSHLNEIARRFPADKILLNISSGTPQMMASLCLETVISSKPLIPVQVATPAGRANQSRVGGSDYDVEWEFKNNLDNEPDAPNRCTCPDILSFKRTLARGQVQALIKKYNYEEAAVILKSYGTADGSPVMRLLQFLAGKKSLNPAANYGDSAEIKKMIGYPEMDGECLEICEYFNVIRILQKTEHLTDFVLRLNPLVTELQSRFLANCLGFSIESITDERGQRKNKKLVRRAKIKAFDPGLLSYIDECFDGEFRDSTAVNIRLQNCLIAFFIQNSKNAGEQERSFAGFLQAMENLNQDSRNLAAHNLYGVSEEEIRQKAGMSSSRIVDRLENLIKHIYKSRCKQEIFGVFDRANAFIVEKLG